MKGIAVWVVVVAVSMLLGVALYSTSLKGSTPGYQQAVMSPRPAPTVIKHKTRIVRKPAMTKIVYVSSSPATQNGSAPAATGPVTAAPNSGSSSAAASHDDISHDRVSHDD